MTSSPETTAGVETKVHDAAIASSTPIMAPEMAHHRRSANQRRPRRLCSSVSVTGWSLAMMTLKVRFGISRLQVDCKSAC